MPAINATCPDCGRKGMITFGSRCVSGRLHWFASHRCNDCDFALEEDALDSIPSEYRILELQQEGAWSIQLAGNANSSTTALKLLREFLGCTLSEIAKIKSQLPGTILVGTRAEMDTVADRLAKGGIQADVVCAQAGISEHNYRDLPTMFSS